MTKTTVVHVDTCPELNAKISVVSFDDWESFSQERECCAAAYAARAQPNYIGQGIQVDLPAVKRSLIIVREDGNVEVVERQAGSREQIASFVRRAEDARRDGFKTVAINDRIYKPRAVWWNGYARINGSTLNDVATGLYRGALIRSGRIAEDTPCDPVVGVIAIEIASTRTRSRARR